ncbi:ABC transporter substrate-binding protein [Magnetococcus sp. PR-3]|uniref:ABC transporter substrate-binding protein n=1 Tax=Magnetococcus sp. PR-3 TaxID=3120355 RepID=UPI002FCE1F4F
MAVLLLLGSAGVYALRVGVKPVVPVHMAAILSLSGSGKLTGEDVLSGLQLAVTQLNRKGGIQGRPVTLHIKDSATDTEQAKQALVELEQKISPLIYFTNFSRISLALAPLAGDYQVPLMGLVTSAPSLSQQNRWSFRFFTDAQEECRVARLSMHMEHQHRFSILYLDDPYGRSVVEACQAQQSKSLVMDKAYPFPPKTKNFGPYLDVLDPHEPLYVLGFISYVKIILQQLKKRGHQGAIYTGAGSVLAIQAGIGGFNEVRLSLPAMYNPQFSYAKPVRLAYQKAYQRPMSHYAANGHEAVRLVSGLLKHTTISRGHLRARLNEGFIFPSLFGSLHAIAGSRDINIPLLPARHKEGSILFLQ